MKEEEEGVEEDREEGPVHWTNEWSAGERWPRSGRWTGKKEVKAERGRLGRPDPSLLPPVLQWREYAARDAERNYRLLAVTVVLDAFGLDRYALFHKARMVGRCRRPLQRRPHPGGLDNTNNMIRSPTINPPWHSGHEQARRTGKYYIPAQRQDEQLLENRPAGNAFWE